MRIKQMELQEQQKQQQKEEKVKQLENKKIEKLEHFNQMPRRNAMQEAKDRGKVAPKFKQM